MIHLKLKRPALALLAVLVSWMAGYSQYILNGAATKNNCNCYTLTTQTFTQSGSVWNSNKINLNNSFDFNFNVYLGCQDVDGADGIVFILQPVSTSLGATGEGMGFNGIAPSIGISLDTWQNINLNDPAFDHISIQANGVVAHGTDLAGPVQALPDAENIEDCEWHTLRISWDPVTQWVRAYFDGHLRVEAQVNLIGTVFNNDPNVYWGFTAATGGANNLQQFCTALNPNFSTSLGGNSTCTNEPISFTDNSFSFAPVRSWYWDFGDGTTSTQKDPPPHLYPGPGIYPVKMVITGSDGCVSDTLKRTVTIGTKPISDFGVFDTCTGKPLRLTDQSTNAVGTINHWTWVVDGTVAGNGQHPTLILPTQGLHTIKLVVKTDAGCESDTMTKIVIANPVPVIDMAPAKGCINDPVDFSAIQVDNSTIVTQWNWDFGNGATSSIQNPKTTYTQAGNMTVQLNATASNGCVSAGIIRNVPIGKITVKTNRDTTILPLIPFQLTTTWSSVPAGTPAFSWTPTAGLSDPFIHNPELSINDDAIYVLKATTAEGCEATDTVNIKVFKGSAVYVPTGFTPNGDGRNDYLRGLYIGIKKVHYFRIYNRWGQQIFSTNSLTEGWDGTINGTKQQTGTFIWMLKAEDLAGKIYEMKGTSTLIR